MKKLLPAYILIAITICTACHPTILVYPTVSIPVVNILPVNIILPDALKKLIIQDLLARPLLFKPPGAII